jgi:hypothetical protein
MPLLRLLIVSQRVFCVCVGGGGGTGCVAGADKLNKQAAAESQPCAGFEGGVCAWLTAAPHKLRLNSQLVCKGCGVRVNKGQSGLFRCMGEWTAG